MAKQVHAERIKHDNPHKKCMINNRLLPIAGILSQDNSSNEVEEQK
jgi:hypothetical protein